MYYQYRGKFYKLVADGLECILGGKISADSAIEIKLFGRLLDYKQYITLKKLKPSLHLDKLSGVVFDQFRKGKRGRVQEVSIKTNYKTYEILFWSENDFHLQDMITVWADGKSFRPRDYKILSKNTISITFK